MNGEFSVYQYFRDDTSMRVLAYVDSHTALRHAAELIRGSGVYLGTIRRIVVTDKRDIIQFEWLHGHGIIWPPKEPPPHDPRTRQQS